MIQLAKTGVLIYILLLFASCERDITVDLPQPESKVVVDGYVEAGKPVYIFLSRNAPYFAPIDPSSVNLAEKGAIVNVSDGVKTVTLNEMSFSINGISVGGLYVSFNTTTFDTLMKGEPGRTYSLEITTSKGERLTSSAHLHQAVPLDSIWFQVQESLPDNDSLGYIWATLHDPDTLNNCYRWMAMRAGKDTSFIAPFGSAFEDKFINGTTFDFAYQRGTVINSSAEDDNNDEKGFFKKGDSIIVKFCTINRDAFVFWRDAETQVSNNGSPFSASSPVKSNIEGGLGLFATYNPSYYFLRAQ